MTITIENAYVGYSIKLSGDRRKYKAKDVNEVVEAVKHYYMKPHSKTHCPLCRSISQGEKMK